MSDTKTVKDFAHHGPFAMVGLYQHLNLHTQALKLIAKHYGLTSHVRVFGAIYIIQSEETHISDDVGTLRRRWEGHLKEWVRQNASAEDKAYLRGLL